MICPILISFVHALSGRKIVIILDEFEIGFESIKPNYQAKNFSFLQMLSEESLRTEGSSITLFASVYNSNKDPGSTLKRVPRIEIKFS